jgi:hypothetical protein
LGLSQCNYVGLTARAVSWKIPQQHREGHFLSVLLRNLFAEGLFAAGLCELPGRPGPKELHKSEVQNCRSFKRPDKTEGALLDANCYKRGHTTFELGKRSLQIHSPPPESVVLVEAVLVTAISDRLQPSGADPFVVRPHLGWMLFRGKMTQKKLRNVVLPSGSTH